jgi:hypothetical protein
MRVIRGFAALVLAVVTWYGWPFLATLVLYESVDYEDRRVCGNCGAPRFFGPRPMPSLGASSAGAHASFDAAAARAALGRRVESLQMCHVLSKRIGTDAEITWAPDGHVARVNVSDPFEGTWTGACAAWWLEAARVPAFDGPPTAMLVTFLL